MQITIHRADDTPRWQIVEETREDEEAPVKFAVLRDERRVAWGLRDHEAAARWLRRLQAPVQAALEV